MHRWIRNSIVTVAFVALAATAGASTWGGQLGNIHLSFTEGPGIEHVLSSEPLPKVGVIVDLYALMTDVPPVVHNHERILSVGGYELQLAVEGAEWKILKTDLPDLSVNAGIEKGCLYVGKYNGMKFVDGVAQLAHWRLQLLGEPENVVFRLDPAGVNSCVLVEGCDGTGTQAIWTGSGASNQVGLVFGAGYVPAYLNWTGEDPDLTPVRGEVEWHELGLIALDD